MKMRNQRMKGAADLVLSIRQSIWRRDGFFRVLWSIVAAAAVTFLVFSMNRLLFPVYRDLLEKDATVQIVATGERNSASLGTNIRLSGIRINGADLDLSKIKCAGNWKYSETEDFLYAYNVRTPDKLTIEIDDVLSMDLTFVSERGAGIVSVAANGEAVETRDLYSDTKWTEVSVRYDTSVFAHPEQHGMIWLLLFTAVFGAAWCGGLYLPGRIMTQINHVSGILLSNALLASILTIGIWMMQYQSPERLLEYLSGDYLVLLEGYVLVFLVLIFLYQVCQRHWLAYTIVSVVLETLLVVSNIKLNARGTPLLPWDFLVADAALSVVDGYDLSIPPVSISVIACNLIIAYVLFRCRVRGRGYCYGQAGVGGVLAALTLVFFVNTTALSGVWNQVSDTRVYQIRDYYEENGFLVSFVEYCNYLLPVEAPDDYSEETMHRLVEQIIEQQVTSEQPHSATEMPNIIAIMSESFWDVTTLENVWFEEDPLPVLHRLQQETNSGNLLSHVFGGNTVISEFEFLTGFHAAFFPTDYMAYGGNLDDNFCSAASILGKQGYCTVAMHPYAATNYNRNTAYGMLGFQHMVFEDDFPEDTPRIRGYISDDAMYHQIEQVYEQVRKESDAPLFLFGITMQNHGGYWPATLNEESRVGFRTEGYLDTTVAGMDDYFAGLHSADAALGNLISYYEKVEEDTIIIYFGDHMSDAGTKAQKMLQCQSWYQSSSFAVDVESHTVPYVVWSNCDLEIGQHPMMDIGQLFPLVLEQTGVRMPYFWHYLQQQREVLPAFNHAIAVNLDYAEVKLNHLTQQQSEVYHIYELLTYDYIWGERYAAELWDVGKTAG